LGVTTEFKDRFGCKLNVGDWVLYSGHQIGGQFRVLRHGQIKSMDDILGTMQIITIVENDDILVTPGHCMLFSHEDMAMRKLMS
jgi:hypothetical protein